MMGFQTPSTRHFREVCAHGVVWRGGKGRRGVKSKIGGGWACAFSMYPTGLGDLMAVADADQIMPPKSTWFEPKLRSGLLVNTLD